MLNRDRTAGSFGVVDAKKGVLKPAAARRECLVAIVGQRKSDFRASQCVSGD
jgi:hypothetical protein